MSTTPISRVSSEADESNERTPLVRDAVAWSSFLFALLQSVCTFFAAANGLRFAIGLGSLVLGAGAGSMVDRFHADALRIPMIAFAVLGSIVNLAVLVQIRRLRARPAAQWRRQPPSQRRLRMERTQFLLSIATLLIVCVEELFHYRVSGHL